MARGLDRDHHLDAGHDPIWVMSCWAALITPSSSVPTSLEADAAVDGVDSPFPTPDRARATR